MAKSRIVSCSIGPYPRPIMGGGMFDPLPKVNVVFDDGTKVELFAFFPDEISFAESEFIGLTMNEAMGLRHRKDVAYLKS